MKTTADRPPILLFLLWFMAGLTLVTALAALAHTPDATVDEAPSAARAARSES